MTTRTVVLCAGLVLVGAVAISDGCGPPPNQPPVANDQAVGTTAGTAVNITVVATDPDAGPGPLAYILLTSPSNGLLTGGLPTVTYTPNAGFTGCDRFTYQVSDGAVTSNVATVGIAVDNQRPVAADANAIVPGCQTTLITLAGTDPDNCPLPLTPVILVRPVNGTLGTPTGLSIPYTPNSGFAGTDTLTYQVSDGLLTSNNIATCTITVGCCTLGPADCKIRLTLKNFVTDRHVHYHLHLIAFREDVPADPQIEKTYTDFGYVRYTAGVSLGCYSFLGRDLFYYYHRNGRFRRNINEENSPLLSGIAPVTNDPNGRRDAFFNNLDVPAPSLILFHDPQNNVPVPFNAGRDSTTIDPNLANATSCTCDVCAQASWYYVNANDGPIGFTALCPINRDDTGDGRFFRVPAETQDTVCLDCMSAAASLPLSRTDACHWLHNSALGLACPRPPGAVVNVRCYEYRRGSVITYMFTDAGDRVARGATAKPSLKWWARTVDGTDIHLPDW